MNRKTLSAVLSLVIIGAFFLPYLSFESKSFSGMNIIFGNAEFVGLQKSGYSLWVSLLIPLGAFLTLIGANPPGSFSRWMPLIGVAYMLIMLYIRGNTGGNMAIGEFVGFFSYGLWITLVASVILPFTGSRT
jgi:hypothetical protein